MTQHKQGVGQNFLLNSATFSPSRFELGIQLKGLRNFGLNYIMLLGTLMEILLLNKHTCYSYIARMADRDLV